MPSWCAQRIPNIPRRVSGYNLNHLLPENGFNVARALVGSEGTCVTVLRGDMPADGESAAARAGGDRLSRHLSCADHVPEMMRAQADRARRRRRPAGRVHATQRNQSRRAASVASRRRMAAGRSSAARRRREAEAQARRMMAGAGRESRLRRHALLTDDQQNQTVWASPRIRSGRDLASCPASRCSGKVGKTAAVAPDKLGAYLRDLRKLLDEYDYRGDAVRPLRPWLRAHAHQL